MPTARRVPQSRRPRLRSASFSRWFAAARVVGLALLFLLPMQMRAGADDPHPHAMLHLLLDARDGLVDHHDEAGHAAEHDGHEGAAGAHDRDVPAVESSNAVGGAMAMLAAIVAIFVLASARRTTVWPALTLLVGRLLALDPPPPRLAGV